MKIPMPIIIVFLGAWVSLQAFTLEALWSLNAEVAEQRGLLHEHMGLTAPVVPLSPHR